MKMTDSKDDNQRQIEENLKIRTRQFVVNSLLVGGLPILAWFSVQDFIFARYLTAGMLLSIMVFIGGYTLLRPKLRDAGVSSNGYQYFIIAVTLMIGFVLVYVIGIEGKPSRLPYAFVFPIFAFFAFGTRTGLIWVVSFFIALIVTLHLAIQAPGHPAVLAHELIQRFYRGFIMICGLVFLLKYIIAKEQRKLISGQLELLTSKSEYQQAYKDLEIEMAERHMAEAALVESEGRYRRLAETIQDVIWTVDMNFRFTYVSPVAAQMQGWSPAEFLALKVADIMTPESFEKVMAIFSEKLEAGKPTGNFDRSATLEVELLRKGGGSVRAEITAAFSLGKNNRPVGMIGVTRDITDRVRSQKEKEELLERLNRLKKMEALGTLAGGVAHDLNNVLSGIVSYPDLLLLDLTDDSPLRSSIVSIRESGKKAAAIVQDLLTLARRGVTVSEVVNLNDIVNEYLLSSAHQRLRSFHTRVQVEARLDPELSNILGSPVHLFQSLMNLVSNAAEAMPAGGQVTITTANRHFDEPYKGYTEIGTGDYAVLRVLDSGQGISDEDLNRIFEPFYTKKKMGRSGTGLGMAVVWGTVQDHSGFIDLYSVPDKGTDITLYFPTTDQVTEALPDQSPISALRGDGESILIVDDVKEQRDVATQIVEQLGYSARSAASGEEAVAYLKNNKFDLLILDMIMEPGIDGLETYRRILKTSPNQKAIVSSGFAETDRVKEARRLGAGSYLRKPYTVEELGRAIKFVLSSNCSN